MNLMRTLILAAGIAMGGMGLAVAQARNEPLYFFATQAGQVAMDEGEQGGNPFASALIELLGRPVLSFDAFATELGALTRRYSQGFQQPDIVGKQALDWQMAPRKQAEKRVALVLVYSDYSKAGATSLPGARHDWQRISAALTQAGFEVQAVLDPERGARDEALAQFAQRSTSADVALIYTTGHGVEIDKQVHLLPGDYPVRERAAALPVHGMPVTELARRLRSPTINLLFFGGCRNDPF